MKIIWLFIYIIVLLLYSCSFDETEYLSPSGESGSTARFTISDNYLYIVDSKRLRIFSIKNAASPEFINKTDIGFDIETIFSKNDLLFIGSKTAMYIYSIEQPENPTMLSTYDHIQSVDPVVADNDYAYVSYNTNRTEYYYSYYYTPQNQIEIVDIKEPRQPKSVSTYNLNSPKGLAISNKKLFVCDNNEVVVLNVTDPQNIYKITTLYNYDANDIIVHDTLVFLIGDNGFKQLQFKNNLFTYLSKIDINQ
jgi:hypothetical protein